MAFWSPSRSRPPAPQPYDDGLDEMSRHGSNSTPDMVPTSSDSNYDHHRFPSTGRATAEAARQPPAIQDAMSPNDIIIAVMGLTGSGKTTFISRCMGEDVGIGHGLLSYTQDVAIHSLTYAGRTIRLIDTPGFDDTSKADVKILTNIAFWLSHAYRAQPKLLLSGIIYLHPISERRMAGSAMKNLDMMKLLCGEGSLSSVWLTTTMWSRVSPEEGARREQELVVTEKFWGDLVRRGSSLCRHQDNAASAFAIIDQILARGRPRVMQIQRQMVDQHKEVDQTDAGRYLRRNVLQEQDKVQNRLARSAQDLEEKLALQESAEVQELLERQQDYQRQLAEKTRALDAMKLDMDTLRDKKAKELAQRDADFQKRKQEQDAKLKQLDKQLRNLQKQRDVAIKQAEAAETRHDELQDRNFQLMLQRDQAAIAEIDAALAARSREEELVQRERQQTHKQESVFRHTMKVSLAETLIHGAFHAVGAMCVLM